MALSWYERKRKKMKKGKTYRKEAALLQKHKGPKPDPELLKKGCWTDKIW